MATAVCNSAKRAASDQLLVAPKPERSWLVAATEDSGQRKRATPKSNSSCAEAIMKPAFSTIAIAAPDLQLFLRLLWVATTASIVDTDHNLVYMAI